MTNEEVAVILQLASKKLKFEEDSGPTPPMTNEEVAEMVKGFSMASLHVTCEEFTLFLQFAIDRLNYEEAAMDVGNLTQKLIARRGRLKRAATRR